jgi:hypothetical protein
MRTRARNFAPRLGALVTPLVAVTRVRRSRATSALSAALVVLATLAALAVTAGGAAAQAAWDAPLLIQPRRTDGIGLFLTQPEYAGLGAMVTWYGGSETGGFGLRGGLANDNDDNNLTGFGGIDFSGLIQGWNQDFPLDIGWAAGAGVGFGDDGALITFPAALTLGRRIQEQDVVLTPYFSPRITLDVASRSAGERDFPGGGSHLGFSLDLGLDLGFGRTWSLRFGGTVGDHSAVAAGVQFH